MEKNKNKDLKPKNEKGEKHGCWEKYHSNGQLWYKGNYNNGKQDGYWEIYHSNGKLEQKGRYDKNIFINGFSQLYKFQKKFIIF